MPIFTSEIFWEFLIKSQLTKSGPKKTRRYMYPPSIMHANYGEQSILGQNDLGSWLKWSKEVYKRKTIELDQFCVKGCHNFTYFANDVGKRCILFRHCPSTMPCMKCVSGPRMPPIMKCGLAKKSATTKNTGVTGVNQLLNGKIPFLFSQG